MKVKYAYLTVAATMMGGISSYAQSTDPNVVLQQFKDSLNAKASEKGLSGLAMKYARIRNSQESYDSLNKQIVALYPKGDNAFNADIRALYGKTKEGNVTLDEVKQLKDSYPQQTYDKPQTTAGMYYGAIMEAGFAGFLTKDSIATVKLIPELGYNTLNSIAWAMAGKDQHLTVASQMSKLSVDKVYAEIATDSSKVPQNQVKKWRAAMDETASANEDTYAYILAKLGKKKEALKYEEAAVTKRSDDAEMNTRYVTLLNDNGQYQKALDVGSKMYAANTGNAEMLEQIGFAYKKVNPKKTSDTYITLLKGQQATAAKATLAKELINKPAKDFTLKDLTGKTVSLSDYKGKVVVLDFWATWCGPCKMSFPGMQLALNKYKDNPNVVFLFIDTWENTKPEETYEAVSKFIASKKYSFHVLLDQKANENDFIVSGAYQKAYGIKGIPIKFFIGKEGNLQFKEEGYAGSDEKVLESVVERVDFLLSQS